MKNNNIHTEKTIERAVITVLRFAIALGETSVSKRLLVFLRNEIDPVSSHQSHPCVHPPNDSFQEKMATSNSYTAYRWRFLVLASFCLVNASNAIQWICFAPINSLVQQYFAVDSQKVNALSICFLALYLPGTILAMWIFNRFSLRTGLLVGSWMTAIGGWVRFASGFGDTASGAAYGGLLFGQCISALAQPFFTNVPAMVASRWFPVKERDISTTVGTMFNPIGVAIGTIVASAFVSKDSLGQVVGMTDWLLFQALFSTIAAVLVVLLFRDRPPTPASASQQSTVYADQADPKNFGVAMRLTFDGVVKCMKEPDFVWLLCAFGVGLGIFNSLTTVIEQITRPICATPDDASLFGGLLIGLGLVGAAIVGVVMDRTHRYRLALRIGFGFTFVFTVILTLVLRPGMIDGVAALFALLGLFMMPMLPTSFNAAAEVTYPVSEDISSGLLMTAGQLTGIAFIFGLDALIPQTPCNPNFEYPGSSILLVVAVGVSVLFIFLFRGSTKRLAADGVYSGDATALLQDSSKA